MSDEGWRAIGLLTLVAVSVGVGWALRGPGEATDAPQAAASPRAAEDVQALQTTVQRLVRQELQAQLPQAVAATLAASAASSVSPAASHAGAAKPAGVRTAAVTAPRPPLTPQEQAKLVEVSAFVDKIIQSGRLDNEQAAQLRLLVADGPFIESNEAMRQLIVAVNSGRVRVETDEPPF